MRKNILFMIISFLFALSLINNVNAQAITGQAYIENGNIDKANADARKDAMRSFIESELGVNIKSETEVVNNMLVRDSIIAKSDGYVLIKKVISEKQIGNIYQVILDLDVNRNLMETAVSDLSSQLQAISEDSTRSGIHVAIIDDDKKNTALYNDYFIGMLKQIGFRSEINDDVLLYLSQNFNKLDDLELNAQIRRIGRTGDRGMANSIIRGRIGLYRPAYKVEGGNYQATAQINCELIGYDNNTVDVASGYYTYIAKTPSEAERLAKESALKNAAEKLGQEALKTTQQEYKGGYHNIKTTLRFNNLFDKVNQRQDILMALNAINCRVIRSNFLSDNCLQLFISTNNYNNLEELKETILQSLANKYPNIIDSVDSGNIGSTKLSFDL